MPRRSTLLHATGRRETSRPRGWSRRERHRHGFLPAEYKDSREEKWKTRYASASRNLRNRSRRRENGNCPSDRNRGKVPHRWHRSNNRRNRKRSVRQMPGHLPRHRGQRADLRSQKPFQWNSTKAYRQGRPFQKDRASSATTPRENGRASAQGRPHIGEENPRRARSGPRPAGGKTKRPAQNRGETGSVE